MSQNPSHAYLLKKKGREVTIHRNGTPDVSGTVAKVNQEACLIEAPGTTPGTVKNTFIALRDIRGVVSDDWDLSDGN